MANKPAMILFDYGQTLIEESKFDAIKGNRAILALAAKNPSKVTAEQLLELADALDRDISEAFSIKSKNYQQLEIPDRSYSKLLYEYHGIEFSLSQTELETVFWDHAAPGKPTENIEYVLDYLHRVGIRTAVVSNMMFSTQTLENRINALLPENHFEFIIASCDYIFRKPHPRIFELALRKAGLPAESVWFCGDNPYCDVEGAFKAGINPIWYPTYIDIDACGHPAVPHKKIHNWKQLVDLIENG